MKKLLAVLCLLVLSLPAFSQSGGFFDKEFTPALVISIGYVPSYEAVKTSIAYNNLFFKRFGAYTSFETGVDDGRFSNLIGATVNFYDNFYVFGGLDFFTKRGMFKQGLNGRKELGVAWAPIPNLLFKVGYSFNVGVSAEIGFRLPLMRVPPSN